MPITTTAPTITASGISAPSFGDILAYLVNQYQGIFGSDVYLGPDSQDYQLLAVLATAINDANSVAVGIYNAFSPATAQGANLSSVVKINGIERDIATNSTCDVVCVGVAGTILTAAIIADGADNKWNLPPNVVIPSGGQITVTATCATAGAITAAPGTITQILTPTKGWQSVTNLSSATPGAPVETDSQLRLRQQSSVALPSQTVLEGIVGAVESVTGVARVQPYENDTNSTDSNGISAYNIALVVDGGDDNVVAAAIASKKTPGVPSFGSTTVAVTDTYGTRNINFSRPTATPISLSISLTPLAGYTTVIGTEIQAAVAEYVNGLSIGQKVIYTRLFAPANLNGAADGLTYEITQLQVAGGGQALGAADISIAWNAVATCVVSDITITVNS